jgi:hypothetical protein
MITLLAALVLGVPSPDIPSPIGPEPNSDVASFVLVIPIATPAHWLCPDGFSPPIQERN